MSNFFSFITQNVEETQLISKKLASYLNPGTVITLEGELGAGKTSFTQGLAKGLGIDKIVNSPTFTIIKEYNGRLPLYHMDVYRLEGQDDDIGFDEYFYGEGVTVIEWASFIEDYLPPYYLNIKIEKINQEKRKITLEPIGKVYTHLCEEFVHNEDISY